MDTARLVAPAVAVEDQGEDLQDSSDLLSPAEWERYGAILRNTMIQPESLIEDIRREFWRLMDKMGMMEEQVNASRRYVALTTIVYDTLF